MKIISTPWHIKSTPNVPIKCNSIVSIYFNFKENKRHKKLTSLRFMIS